MFKVVQRHISLQETPVTEMTQICPVIQERLLISFTEPSAATYIREYREKEWPTCTYLETTASSVRS